MKSEMAQHADNAGVTSDNCDPETWMQTMEEALVMVNEGQQMDRDSLYEPQTGGPVGPGPLTLVGMEKQAAAQAAQVRLEQYAADEANKPKTAEGKQAVRMHLSDTLPS